MGSWFHSNRNCLKKTQYYVWFLGSKESEGLRGREYVMPIMRDLLKDCLKRLPNKVTVQISEKGLKLVQTVPAMNRYGKVKTETMKFYIPAHSITYSMMGPPPYNDVVATLLLVFNPETKCPIHLHCYRCDSPDTAMIMHSNMQILINRPENQRRILYLEHRLLEGGLLFPPKSVPTPEIRSKAGFDDAFREVQNRHSYAAINRNFRESHYANSSEDNNDYVGISSEDSDDRENVESESLRLARLHQAVFRELKEKLRSEPPILLPPKDYRNTFRKVTDLNSPKEKIYKQLPSNQQAARPLLSPRNSPRENNFFWKKRDKKSESRDDNLLAVSRKLSSSVTALDEGVLSSSTSGLGSDLSSSGGRFRYSIADISSRNLTGPHYPLFNDRDVPETAMMVNSKNLYKCSVPTSDAPRFSAQNLTTLDPHQGLSRNRFFSTENILTESWPISEEEEEKSGRNFRIFGDTFRFTKRSDDVFPQTGKINNKLNSKYKKRQNDEGAWLKMQKGRGFHKSMDSLYFVCDTPEPMETKVNWRNVIDPFGKRHDHNVKVDGFWREKAKRSTWRFPS